MRRMGHAPETIDDAFETIEQTKASLIGHGVGHGEAFLREGR
jgi:hypothetical protein